MIRRILYYGGHDVSTPDGPGTNEFEFTRVLADRFGHDAWCVIPKPAGRVPHLDGMNLLHCQGQPRFRHLPAYVLSAWSTARRIERLCLKHHIDVVCVRLPAFPLVPWLLQRVWRRPLALKTLGNWWQTDPPTSRLDAVVRRMFTACTKAVIRRAHAVDTGLYEILDQLPQLVDNPARYRRVDNAADVNRFRPRDNPQVPGADLDSCWPVLGFIGSYPTTRGAQEAVELASRLTPDYPKLAVLVAGWDNGMEDIRRRAEKLGVAQRCHFLGWVDYAHAPEVVAAMTVGYSFYETWTLDRVGNASQKVRQYLACGKPVISIHSGHAFLREHDLGTCVDHTDLDQVEKATRSWLERIASGEPVEKRLRAYAETNLSSEKAFADRLAFWEERFGC